MTTAAAQAVLDRMESDDAFGERVKDAGGPDAALALLKAEGFEVTGEELRDAVLDRYGDQLSQEQLDALSGGKGEAEIALVAATGTAIAASFAVAAAAV